ncbi:NAD(P)H-dependent oxidoreductase [Psittacicella hinzii]|uniref:NAD(P)H-dependent oxidoreductase n=1 Tax=Psittacicella hinzii TaxID=2028575 RepID=A0A3A1XYP8_9GAMM|nr:NAD(P)H-dependent oxidoreductase [Psittacicella hinzii]RIY31152.1 NAD(P)H-dependent oxidoreductase [Psittacicella hinzii]
MITKQQILDSYNYRHACKKYDPTKVVSKEDMDFILETGRLSPSSFGMEPWKFLVIPKENVKVRNVIDQLCWGIKDKKDASYYVVFLTRKAPELQPNSAYINHMLNDVKQMPAEMAEVYRGFYTQQLSELSNLLGEGNERALEDWAGKQAYIALGNMMTVAAMIGIDSTPVEGVNYHEIDKALVAEGLFDPAVFKVSVLCAFGYRGEEPRRAKTRRNADEVIEWVK